VLVVMALKALVAPREDEAGARPRQWWLEESRVSVQPTTPLLPHRARNHRRTKHSK
jgi:hypothetical protein